MSELPEGWTVTLNVTHRTRPRRRTDDDWWEVLERNPETGAEWWDRWRPLHPVEIAMGLGSVSDNIRDES